MILEARNISKSFFNNTRKFNVFSDLYFELEEMGLIESKREGTKHRLYRRMTRIDISNKKRRV